jgi:2-hydroxychromene-2-carboxylate isomerase
MAEVERRALAYGLPPLCWPQPWPGNYLMAMRAATYAQRMGRLREFADTAFHSGFEHGRDLSIPANVLAAASEAGLDPQEVERALGDPEMKGALREATDEAHRLGVVGVPTLAIAGELFWGDDRLERAAARLAI